LAPIEADAPSARGAERIAWTLRLTTAALLIGHGGFGAFMHKAEWARYLGALGVSSGTVEAAALIPLVGCFEIALGLLVLAAPLPSLLLFAFGWKVGTEALRPLTGEPIWEFIERGGSYAAPLALAVLTGVRPTLGVAPRLAAFVRGRPRRDRHRVVPAARMEPLRTRA
jgi:hypothetical protein